MRINRHGEGSNVALSVSVDGRHVFVAFVSEDNTIVPFDNNVSEDVFLRVIDTVTGTATTEIVSAAAGGSAGGTGNSDRPSVSGDGRYVLFRSKASNLANTSDPPGVPEYYLRDRCLGNHAADQPERGTGREQ